MLMMTKFKTKTKVLILGALVVSLCSVLWVYFVVWDYNETDGRLSKKELTEIANKFFEENCHLDTNNCTVRFDRGNKTWNEYYAQRYPVLTGREYQAIECNVKRKQFMQGGGPYWVCIDTITGEVLAGDAGM
jgi:hypothetical protein